MSIVNYVIVKSTQQPVNFELVKQYLRDDFSKNDVEIDLLLKASMQWVEKFCGKSWTKQTRRQLVTGSESKNPILLKYPPVINIVEVTYIDSVGNKTILSDTDYFLVEDLLYITGSVYADTIIIDYDCGYSDSRLIPQDVQLAVLKKLATDYLVKEDLSLGINLAKLDGAEKILREYKNIELV